MKSGVGRRDEEKDRLEGQWQYQPPPPGGVPLTRAVERWRGPGGDRGGHGWAIGDYCTEEPWRKHRLVQDTLTHYAQSGNMG